MKNISIIVVAAIILVGGYFFFSNNSALEQAVEDSATYENFLDSEVELQFAYKTDPGGYVVDDLTRSIGEQQEGTEVVRVYRIINEREKIELETSEGGREGPPTITVMVFKNLQNQSASVWVDEFGLFSNINLVIGNVNRDAVVGGANAVMYRTDGLYQADTVAVAHGGFVYLFIGAFLEENSTIHQDFKTLINSVEFISDDNSVS